MNNIFDISNRTILITGGSSGLGKELAIYCSKIGANVIITGRNIDRLKQVSKESKDKITYISADLCEELEIQKLVTNIPNLDGVLFCAGIVEYNPIKMLSSKKIQNIFSINFNSQVLLTQQLLKQKKINKKSSLVYISSIASKIGVQGTSMYASSKAALNGFVKVLASELSSQEIRANSVCPGIIMTPMGSEALDMSNDIAKDYPLGLGEPKDILGPCIFLLSDSSKWITGIELIMDGGLTIK
jgi:NAD(P)-dependent dehydrogenase (short-subunit alcohol dehydrogenase family)